MEVELVHAGGVLSEGIAAAAPGPAAAKMDGPQRPPAVVISRPHDERHPLPPRHVPPPSTIVIPHLTPPPVYTEASCCGRSRRWVRDRIVRHWAFDAVVLVLIVFNCITLAMDNPLDPEGTTKAKFLNVTDKIFIGLFAAEAVLKLYGLSVPVYLKDPWNCLDFFIVVAAFLSLLPGVGNFSAIRIVRVLRPLRTLNRVQGLKVIVVTLLDSLKALLQVALLVMFLFTIYSIIAVQLFNGVLRRRCADVATGELMEDEEYICSFGTGKGCPPGFECRGGGPNPAGGVVNFDNFGWSLLNVYVITSLANWIDIHYPLWDATSSFTWVFFVTLILFGSFFALNLVLAVIADAFADAALKQRDQNAADDKAKQQAADDAEESELARLTTTAEDERKSAPGAEEPRGRSSLLFVSSKTGPALAADKENGDVGSGVGLPQPPSTPPPANTYPAAPGAWVTLDEQEGKPDDAKAEAPTPDEITRMFDISRSETPADAADGDDAPASGGDSGESSCVRPVSRGLQGHAGVRLTSVNDDGEEFETPPAGTDKPAPSPPQLMDAPLPVTAADGAVDDLKPSAGGNTADAQVGAGAGVGAGSSVSGGTGLRAAPQLDDEEHHNTLRSLSWGDVLRSVRDPEVVHTLRKEELGFDPDFLPVSLIIVRDARVVVNAQRQYLSGKPGFILWLNKLVLLRAFNLFIVLAIVANTVTLGMEYHGMSDSLRDFLEDANVVFTTIFAVEMVLKIAGLGFRVYVADRFNVFDAVIVVVSLIELGVGGGGGIVSVFRAFRLMRVLKLAKSFMSLRILLATVGESVANVSYMTILLVLFVFMFSVLGMQLFAGTFTEDLVPPADYHFDNLGMSILSVFQILTGDDWPLMMHDARNGSGNDASVLYFILVTMFGMYIVVSLFIAILLERFALQDETKFQHEDLRETAKKMLERLPDVSTDEACRPAVIHVAKQLTELEDNRLEEKAKRFKSRTAKLVRKLEGTSLGIFSATNPLRVFLFNVVSTMQFEAVVIILIFANCVFLAMENPGVDDDSSLGQLIKNMDIFFAVVFTLEMVMKIIAWGSWRPESSAYFRNAWNGLDAFVVLVSIVSLVFPSFSVARSFRALRPLRVVVRSRKIQVVLNALILALPNIANVMVLALVFWLIFAILGVSLFAGTFRACNDETITLLANCVGTFDLDGVVTPRVWANVEAYSFDDIGEAVLTLFRVATLSGWGDVTRVAMSARSTTEAPEPEAHPLVAIYFYLFIVVCSFFALNLFIGVVIDNFNRLRKEYEGSAFLTEEQRQWANMQKLLSSIKLKVHVDRPKNAIRVWFFDVIQHPKFDLSIMGAILLNTITMTFEHYDQPDGLTDFLTVANYLFVAVFTAEAVFKIIALGFLAYWKDDWNKFDFVVVVLSLVGLFVDAGVGANVVRVFRIARIFRLIHKAETLRNLFQTLVVSVPSLWNIGSLLFVLFFIFAVLGVSFFGDVEQTEDGLDRHANFETFGLSLLTLWRLATGDAWEEVMYACRDAKPLAPLYFVAFVVFGGLVMVNLFIAVILENFGEALSGAERAAELQKANLWVEVWQRYDPRALNYVPAALFTELMLEAPQPFGFHYTPPEEPEGSPRAATPAASRNSVTTPSHTPRNATPRIASPSALGPRDRVAILREYRRFHIPLVPVAVSSLAPSVASQMMATEPLAAPQQVRDGWPGDGEVWALEFNHTLKALAKVVIALDVDIEIRGTVGAWLHEWYAALMIQRLYRAKYPSLKRHRLLEKQALAISNRSRRSRRGTASWQRPGRGAGTPLTLTDPPTPTTPGTPARTFQATSQGIGTPTSAAPGAAGASVQPPTGIVLSPQSALSPQSVVSPSQLMPITEEAKAAPGSTST